MSTEFTEEGESRLFAGTSTHALDAKNRVTIPARWRLEKDGEFFALPDPVKPAIGLLLPWELRQLMADARANPALAGSRGRTFLRHYFSQAFPCPIDRQGRIVLPAEMCRAAGLSGEVVLVGTGIRIEVWDPGCWRAEIESTRDHFREAAEHLGL